MIVRTRALTITEAAAYMDVLEAAGPHEAAYAAISALAIGLGARIGEVLALRNADVLDPIGQVRDKIRRKISKKRKEVVYREAYFCDPRLRAIVQRYADSPERKGRFFPGEGTFVCFRWSGRRISYLSAWKHNRNFLRAAGIEPGGVAFHGLRKTFMTAVYQQIYADSGDMLKALTCVQRLAGHDDFNTTLAYLDISEVDLETTIGRAVGIFTGKKICKV